MREVHDYLSQWMEASGLSARVDNAGTYAASEGLRPSYLLVLISIRSRTRALTTVFSGW